MDNNNHPQPLLYRIFTGVLIIAFAVAVVYIWTYIFNSNNNDNATTDEEPPLSNIFSSNAETIVVSPTKTDAFLPNPGIGLQYDPTTRNATIPETVIYAPRQDISWDILNPAEGIFQWDILDAYLQQAVSEGKLFSFRVYTMRGEDYGKDRVPQWVQDKGVNILSTGDPNYQSCVYQDEWAKFVDALRQRYDGNPDIAYIDISGYSAFNEWNWNDAFTDWDFQWEETYAAGNASPADFTTLDGQARRRLVDMFVGGSFTGHQCQQPNGTVTTVDYDYPGFQYTQLVMPYAGVRQSTQYVVTKNADVGFRFDCLGDEYIGHVDGFRERLADELAQTWPVAPVIFEFCGGLEDYYPEIATPLLQLAHGSLVHSNDNVWEDQAKLLPVITPMGYRYELQQAVYLTNIQVQEDWEINTTWANVGYAPSYPKMGQEFSLHYYFTNEQGQIAAEFIAPVEISSWMPADPLPGTAPQNTVATSFSLPASLQTGTYTLQVAILDELTGQPINLAIEGKTDNGFYSIGSITVIGK